jgi:3-dehydroquinate synthase
LGTGLIAKDDLPLPPAGQVITTSSRRTRAYSIYITPGQREALELIAAEVGSGKVTVVTDRTVESLHARRMSAWLAARGVSVRNLVIAPGERSKSVDTAVRLLDSLANSDVGRHDLLLAVGGGVVIDTAGWVASAYMRGIRYVNVPTTLLAQVDAAIGGKVGVDHGVAKNLIGAF